MCYDGAMEKRLTGYIDEQDHRALKARLAAQGLKINDWLRRVVKLELEGRLAGGEQTSRVVLREVKEQDDAGKDD